MSRYNIQESISESINAMNSILWVMHKIALCFVFAMEGFRDTAVLMAYMSVSKGRGGRLSTKKWKLDGVRVEANL